MIPMMQVLHRLDKRERSLRRRWRLCSMRQAVNRIKELLLEECNDLSGGLA